MADDEGGAFGFFDDDGDTGAAAAPAQADALREITSGLVVGERVLGEGGSSRVLLGTLDGVEVAIKIVREGMVGAAADAQTEARLLHTLRHAHVVSVVGFGRAPVPACLVTEPLLGGTLAHVLFHVRDAGLDFEWRTKMVRDVAAGLRFLHDKKIIHGDIKTSNVALTADRRTAKLTDFGLACVIREAGDSPVKVQNLGDSVYAAPELRSSGATPTTDADVYSFGLLAWETYTAQQLLPNMRPVESPDAGVGAGAGAQGEEGEDEGEERPEVPDWMPDLPEETRSPEITNLLRCCLRVRTQSRWPVSAVARAADRIHGQARQVVVAAANPAPWVAELPLEVALQIFPRLSPQGICAVRGTCLAWRLLVDAWSDDIYRSILERHFGGRPGATPPDEFVMACERAVRSMSKSPAIVPWALSGGHHVIVEQLLREGRMKADGYTKVARYTDLAASQGNARMMHALLAAGAPVDAKLLEVASKKGDVPTILAIIDAMQSHKGTLADFSQLPLDRMMTQAATMGVPRMVAWLLSAGASPNTPPEAWNGGAKTTLAAAAKSGSLETVELLLAAGASLVCTVGPSALASAVDAHSLAIVNRLLEAGHPICVNNHGKPDPCVHNAAAWPVRLPILQRLVDADPRAIDWRIRDNVTPIEVAVANANVGAVEFLLTRGCSLAPDPFRRMHCPLSKLCHTQIHEYTFHRSIAMLKWLLAHMTPEEVRAARYRGCTPLYSIHFVSHYLPWLTEACALPEMRALVNMPNDIDHQTCLHAAAIRGYAAMNERINHLMDLGALPMPDDEGRMPLMLLACLPAPATIQRLIAAGDSLTRRDNEGRTQMMMTCVLQEMEKWIALGADPRAVDDHGDTPLHYLCRWDAPNSWHYFIDLVLKYGVNAGAVNDRGRTALHTLTEYAQARDGGYWDPSPLISVFCNNGCDVNAINEDGDTALVIAQARGLDRMARIIQRQMEGALPVWTPPADQ